jgi:Cof subfamily protein (haloacid dehalogenase superfamily)
MMLPPRISLVVSDVDGTLVTPDKELTDASVRAVATLAERGIKFTVTSSRPPFGLRMLLKPLNLKLPVGAFNGGCVVDPSLVVLEQHTIPVRASRRAIELLRQRGVDVWLFTADAWLLRDLDGVNVERERHTVQTAPSVVEDLTPRLDQAMKIVGVSNDFDRLAQCEQDLRVEIGADASVSRSQRYYLDIIAPGVDKGVFVRNLSARVGVPREEIATIGDMENDLPMFAQSGLSIAMGNADDHVKSHASHVTASNANEGFAEAVARHILPVASGA